MCFPARSSNLSNSSSSIYSDYPWLSHLWSLSWAFCFNPTTFLVGSKPRIDAWINTFGYVSWGKMIDTTLSPNNFLRITIKWSLCAIMSSFWPHHNKNPIIYIVTIPTIFPACFLILLVFQIHGDITHKSRETGPVISPLIDSYHISLSHMLFPILHDNCVIWVGDNVYRSIITPIFCLISYPQIHVFAMYSRTPTWLAGIHICK